MVDPMKDHEHRLCREHRYLEQRAFFVPGDVIVEVDCEPWCQRHPDHTGEAPDPTAQTAQQPWPPEGVRCETCAWSDIGEFDVETGECRYSAPEQAQRQKDEHEAWWQRVPRDAWCRLWKPRDPAAFGIKP